MKEEQDKEQDNLPNSWEEEADGDDVSQFGFMLNVQKSKLLILTYYSHNRKIKEFHFLKIWSIFKDFDREITNFLE